MKTWLAVLVATLGLGGCVNMNFTQQAAGSAAVGPLQLEADGGWNVAPRAYTPFAREGAQVWTRDGLLLDRLLIIPAVADGEPIFVERDKAVALPRYKADMLPDELAQLAESSLVKLLGEGSSVVKLSNLRPAKFGKERGILFDLAATPQDGPFYRGLGGAFIADKKLNLVLFMAAEPYYFDKHKAAAQSLIDSVRL